MNARTYYGSRDGEMNRIERYDVNEKWAHSGIIKAGDFCFLNYCVRNIGGTIEEQINGVFDVMEERLALVGLTLENVVQMNCLFKNIYKIISIKTKFLLDYYQNMC